MSHNAVILAGHGPSAAVLPWPDLPIAAVSGGHAVCPRTPDMFITLDMPQHFPRALCEHPAVTKHVPDFRDSWNRFPNVTMWQRGHQSEPVFAQGLPLAAGYIHNSLLFAVQVVALMGYRDIVFVGCDLKGATYAPLLAEMKRWHPIAKRRRIRWHVHGEGSAMADFLPQWKGEPCRA